MKQGTADMNGWPLVCLLSAFWSALPTVWAAEQDAGLSLSKGLAVHYPMDEGQGLLLKDRSGKDNDGNRLPEGNYTLEITALDGSGEQVPVLTFFEGKVDGVQYIEGLAFLNVDGALVPLADIMEISAG